MEIYSEKTCREFIDVLSSKAPAPGGGGAAALCGAVAAALGNMVGSLTAGKKKYAAVEDEIIELKKKSDALQNEFLSLIDADAKAFEPLSKAYSLPKDTPEEAEYKAAVIEKCSKDACAVPLKIMEKCCEAIDVIAEFAKKGSVLALSDAGCAAAICKGALYAASLNIFINTKSLSDRKYAADMNSRAESMLSGYGKKADEIFEYVKDNLIV